MAEVDGAEVQSNDPSARVGTIVDKYTLIRVLGRGGMGAVYEARHATLSRRFAIKFLLPELATNREILRRFENEAKAAGGLEHPNLAAVTDFGRAADGAPYIVMEFLPGEDCAKLLKRVGPLPIPRAANIVAQACRGLAVAHQAGIVHRDLKPENLFLTDAGDGSDLIKVLDFGIAKLRVSDASVVTGTGATFGTAFYMSPEQARGAGEVDARTDVWSLGVVLYELLSGQKPFAGEQFLQVIHQILSVEPPPLAALRSGLPPKLGAVIERAMAKDLAGRVQSVLGLAEALGPFLGGRATGEQDAPVAAMAATAATPETITGPSPGLSRAPVSREPTAPPGRSDPSAAVETVTGRRGRPFGLVILVVLAIAGLGLLALTRGPRERAPEAVAPLGAVAPPAAVAAPVPAQPVPATPAAAPGTAAPAHARPSEPFEQSPDKRPLRKPARRASTPAAPEPPKPAPAATAPSVRHPVDIEKDNPYGP